MVTRDEVGAYKPYLWEQSTFYNGVLFREWILTKIVNGERASYSAPKFARMQERTRSQMLEDIVANLQNHAETGQIPKPYRFFTFLLCRPDGPVPTRPEFGNISSTRYRFASAAAAALKSHHQRERLTVDGNVLFPGLLDWCQPINRISAPVFPAAAADVVTLTKMRRIINK